MTGFRIGQGYDVHRLTAGRPLILGGVRIPYKKGLLGHSDADVLTHSVMDALLGASGFGDIGILFPDTDPQYAGISSLILLSKVGELLRKNEFIIGNIDTTLIAQAPKIGPYRKKMRENLARALKISEDCMNIKATTEEHLGFTGNGSGIAAQAIVFLQKKVG